MHAMLGRRVEDPFERPERLDHFGVFARDSRVCLKRRSSAPAGSVDTSAFESAAGTQRRREHPSARAVELTPFFNGEETMTFRIKTSLALLIALGGVGLPAFAQDRYRDHEFDRNAPPMRFDQHYHHDHYYPARGYAFGALPRDSVRIGFRGGDYYYHAGVWFHPEGGRFIVSAPPFGIIVPVLPPAYATVTIGGAPYYYANGVYYAPAPGQGYTVVPPPPGAESDADDPGYSASAAPPPPPSQTPPPSYGAPSEPIVYPRNNQPPEQVAADKSDCFRWATQNNAGASADVFQRAFGACMDGRGYSVR